MKKIIVFIFIALSQHAMENSYTSTIEFLPDDMCVEIAAKLIEAFPRTELGVLEAGKNLCSLSEVNKKWNRLIQDERHTQFFIGEALDRYNLSIERVAGYLKTKGASNQLKKISNWLLDTAIDEKEKTFHLLDLALSCAESERLALLSQDEHAKKVSRALKKIHGLTAEIRRNRDKSLSVDLAQLETLFDFFTKSTPFRCSLDKFIGCVSGNTLDGHAQIHFFEFDISKGILRCNVHTENYLHLKKIISPLVTQKEDTIYLIFCAQSENDEKILLIQSFNRMFEASLSPRPFALGAPIFSQDDFHLHNAYWHDDSLLVNGVTRKENAFFSFFGSFFIENDTIQLKDDLIIKPITAAEDTRQLAIDSAGTIILGNHDKICLQFHQKL